MMPKHWRLPSATGRGQPKRQEAAIDDDLVSNSLISCGLASLPIFVDD
eukprot:CAMPEP_0185377118 /NCGR_PEP_ID=MMETSP1364-20130426/41274_1 /TAXON_ID=38817 /ORGANISM="Gephyrocapsa oceanica, Strain RCC1303" /LENGTH=47 /DNA_ID= /DNA_START= /DNA_END= /DNA_ORIENTATION=